MKKFILMLFAVFMMFSSMAQADPVIDGFSCSHEVASDKAPDLNIAIAGNIGMERTWVVATVIDKETTSDYTEITVVSIGACSGGVCGGGTIGAIRS